jgi:predicted nucleic acid-binding protein
MPAEVFLDTNILVYSFDPDSPAKQRRAKELLAGPDWMVSWQVIQEFSSVALHRFKSPLLPQDLSDYVSLKLWPRCRILPSEVILTKAIAIHARYGFRYYDSLIVASAMAGSARTLYSEDLQHGQTIDSLTIQNPFLG